MTDYEKLRRFFALPPRGHFLTMLLTMHTGSRKLILSMQIDKAATPNHKIGLPLNSAFS